jgi:hypothetical protein
MRTDDGKLDWQSKIASLKEMQLKTTPGDIRYMVLKQQINHFEKMMFIEEATKSQVKRQK